MLKTVLRLALCVSVVGLLACGSDDGDDDGGSTTPTAPCNELGGACPAGQVCWPNASQTGFECLNAAVGAGKGSTCVNTLGSATCDEGLACVMLQGQTSGSCMTYCDPAIAGKGCEAGETCTQFMLPGVGSAYVCLGAVPEQDGGVEAGPDTGTSNSEAGVSG